MPGASAVRAAAPISKFYVPVSDLSTAANLLQDVDHELKALNRVVITASPAAKN